MVRPRGWVAPWMEGAVAVRNACAPPPPYAYCLDTSPLSRFPHQVCPRLLLPTPASRAPPLSPSRQTPRAARRYHGAAAGLGRAQDGGCCGRQEGLRIDNLLVRTHFIIVMIRWTGLAPWESESPFPGSLTSTFLTPWEVPWCGRGAAVVRNASRRATRLSCALDPKQVVSVLLTHDCLDKQVMTVLLEVPWCGRGAGSRPGWRVLRPSGMNHGGPTFVHRVCPTADHSENS